MKKILFFLIITTYIFGQTVTVDIKADKFSTNKDKNITIFTGHVVMTKGKNILKANKLTIKTIQNKNSSKTIIKEYIGVGNVFFSFTNAISTIKGKGDKVFYYPLEFRYVVVGNGYLEDSKDLKKLTGDKIFLNEKTGDAKIQGKQNKPVKFSFQVEDKGQN
jgi:lipopolysaccharide export system protein LptA